jgi:hypothetical protein
MFARTSSVQRVLRGVGIAGRCVRVPRMLMPRDGSWHEDWPDSTWLSHCGRDDVRHHLMLHASSLSGLQRPKR